MLYVITKTTRDNGVEYWTGPAENGWTHVRARAYHFHVAQIAWDIAPRLDEDAEVWGVHQG